jgi:predicted house-cleaning noncanonical NTP pyrophosphatase (MazG superfamily)
MTDGKLVRDLIPDLIRQSGRQADVRHLSGEDLVSALGAKLREEAQEAADALDSREKLIEELADITEVMSALMAIRGIPEHDVVAAAQAKALQRGRFESGTWLISAVPESIRQYGTSDVDAQRVKWRPEQWAATFAGHEGAHADLTAHSQAASGIARSFIHGQSERDPVDLFLMAMAWGYGPNGYGPTRTKAVLDQDGAEEKLAAIVEATRSDGAAAGWHALLVTHKIKGLNMSFGTKLLYFAGYTTEQRPRPLILDERVRASLQKVAPGAVPAKGWVREADYLRFLDLAELWASEPTWEQAPDVVEYGLFAM